MKLKLVTLLSSSGAIVLLGVGQFVLYQTFHQCPGHIKCTVDPGVSIGRTCQAIGLALAVISWLLGMLATASIRRWGWLVLVFLLAVVGALLYGIFGPTQPTQRSV